MAKKGRKNNRRRTKHRCMYCGRPAGSNEHVIATRFIEVLQEDPRGLVVPLTLQATLSSGQHQQIEGKRAHRKSGARPYTLEYTAPVCDDCNSGWMNNVDTAALPYVAEMIRGNQLLLDQEAQAAVAAWMCKVAVTARGTKLDPLPIESDWTSWLYSHHSALPTWQVWIGRYVGEHPWWYFPHDIRIELGEGSGPPPPGFVQPHGVVATLVVGYLLLQVFGVSGAGPSVIGMHAFGELPRIWPASGASQLWPLPYRIDDTTLPAVANRLIGTAAIP